jgi:glycosyltransferase involved in cell wall biosynthesis
VKLLVFAHTPPPYHGQSYMVKLMLEGLPGPAPGNQEALEDIEFYHVDARFSTSVEDMGSPRWSKFFNVWRYFFQVLKIRFRYGVKAFYFAPAPPKRLALYRDWLVMLLCRPFFPTIIQHWHAAGLGDWLHSEASRFERWATNRLLGRASLGIALAAVNCRDPLWLEAEDVAVVPNGLTDPFPNFAIDVRPARDARLAKRQALLDRTSLVPPQKNEAGDPEIFRVLYLAHCFREKGLFETIDGVAIAEARLRASDSPIHLRLTVAGDFNSEADREAFFARIQHTDVSSLVDYTGFVAGERKLSLLRESDCLCFPTYFAHESFGLVVLEAMAAGLPVLATKWRALPEILPPSYPGFVPPRDAAAIAATLPKLFVYDSAPLREWFLERFTESSHLAALRTAILRLSTRNGSNPPG